jgi:hypothetical protein
MDKNLPLVSLPFLDKQYNNFIIPFLKKLDDGNIFKEIITFLITFSSFALLIGGFYETIMGLFGDDNIAGDDGFFMDFIWDAPYGGGQKFGASLGMLIGFSISLITAWALYSVLKKRAEQLKELEYSGILDFVFNKTFPKVLLIIGELLFVLLLSLGVLQIFAALCGSYVYAPLSGSHSGILELFGMEAFDVLSNSIYGDYDYFKASILKGVTGIASSFAVLIAFYLYKEIYSYGLKLITCLVRFLPKFAIPFAIRKRNDN